MFVLRQHLRGLVAALLILAITTSGLLQAPYVLGRRYAADGTSTSAALYSDASFQQQLEQSYPGISDTFADADWTEADIPGLISTNTLTAKAGSATGTYKHRNCNEMTPQGICVSGDYIFITAYCASRAHASVIYVLNKDTGAYIKTIALDGTPHVGGIAYAPDSGGLWVTTNQSKVPGWSQIALIKMDAIEAYDLASADAPIEYDLRLDLEELPAASSISFSNGFLIVGYFDKSDSADIVCYQLGEGGIPRLPYTAGNTIQQLTAVNTYGGVKKAQGVCADYGHVYVSQSYGTSDSKLLVVGTGLTNFASPVEILGEDVVGWMEFPAYMEQMVIDGDDVYVLFEGAASKYRDRKVSMHVDRVLKLSKKKILNLMTRNTSGEAVE